MSIPISTGSGAASVAAEVVGGLQYQQIEILGAGGASVVAVQRLDQQVIGSTLGLVAHAVIHGLSSGGGGGYVDVKVDPSGALVTTAASVIAYQAPGSTMAVSFSAAANQSVSGAVTAPAGSVMTTAALAGSVMAVRTDAASVITVWQNSSVITTWKDSSVLAVPVGSTITTFSQGPSIVGTYAGNAAHTQTDKGIFVHAVRNDTLASVTSADGNYSPFAVGVTGALTAHDAPISKWVQGIVDLRGSSGGSIVAIAAQGASVFTYIREVQVANMGSASVLVTIAGGLGSVLGYTIAPAGGGSNYTTRLKTGENSAVTASISGIASVLVTMTGFISKT